MSAFLAVVGRLDSPTIRKFRQAMVAGAINGTSATEVASWRTSAQQFDYHRSSINPIKFFDPCDGGCAHIESVGRVLNPVANVLMGMNHDKGDFFFKGREPRPHIGLENKKLGLKGTFNVNTKTNHVQFMATKDRPLWMVYTGNYRNLWVTSDINLLQFVLRHSDEHAKRFQVGFVQQLKPGVYYSVMLDAQAFADGMCPRYTKFTSVVKPVVADTEEKPELVLDFPADAESAKRVEQATRVPEFTREEIREMPTIDDVRDHKIAKQFAADASYKRLRQDFIKVARNNWSDYVTWSEKTRVEVARVVNRIENNLFSHQALLQSIYGLEAEIKVRLSTIKSKDLFKKNKFLPPVNHQQATAQAA
jgi:hypothetical protein